MEYNDSLSIKTKTEIHNSGFVQDHENGQGAYDQHHESIDTPLRGLSLGSFGLLLKSPLVCEVVESARISPVPGVSRLFKGFLNHRGIVVPVYDVMEFIQHEWKEKWLRKRVLLFYLKKDTVALVIYELPKILTSCRHTHIGQDLKIPDIFIKHTLAAQKDISSMWLWLDYAAFFSDLANMSTEYQ